MAVDDLWFKSTRGPDGKRVKSSLHGKGKRYRVRYVDAAAAPRTRFFERKADADDFDARARSGIAQEVVAHPDRKTTFREYAERWRLSRRVTQSLDYQRHTDSRLRHQLYPALGNRPIAAITVTDVLEWIASRRDAEAAQTSIKTYFDLLNNIMNSAVADKKADENPCKAIRLSMVLRGLSRVPKWVPNDGQVLALLDAVPDQYQAAIWLGAGEGMRIGEVLGIEAGTRCVDYLRDTVHVVQQLKFHKGEYGGFYLAPPKGNSTGDVDLDDHVKRVLGDHVRRFKPVSVSLPDITYGTPDPGQEPPRREVELLFTDEQGRPIHDQRWSKMWQGWRTAAGWPDKGTFHSLRHYFATTLITQGVDPTDVQRALRHSSLRITLETYVHWWPNLERRRSVVSEVLRRAQNEPQFGVRAAR